MPDYRLHLLDMHTGHIDDVEEFRAADDDEAVQLTNLRCYDVPAELWCGHHKVARFDVRPEQAMTVPPNQRPDEFSLA